MTLQEAIKSGKPFRRKAWINENAWHGPVGTYDGLTERVDDILADDWETKPSEPQWKKVYWTEFQSNEMSGKRSGTNLHRIREDDVLLVDSRPVEALKDAIEYLISYWPKIGENYNYRALYYAKEEMKKALKPVAELLKESP